MPNKTAQEQLQALDWFAANIQVNYSKNLQSLQLYGIDITPIMHHTIIIERELSYLRNILINKANEEQTKK
jgi:hypothetical protein